MGFYPSLSTVCRISSMRFTLGGQIHAWFFQPSTIYRVRRLGFAIFGEDSTARAPKMTGETPAGTTFEIIRQSGLLPGLADGALARGGVGKPRVVHQTVHTRSDAAFFDEFPNPTATGRFLHALCISGETGRPRCKRSGPMGERVSRRRLPCVRAGGVRGDHLGLPRRCWRGLRATRGMIFPHLTENPPTGEPGKLAGELAHREAPS